MCVQLYPLGSVVTQCINSPQDVYSWFILIDNTFGVPHLTSNRTLTTSRTFDHETHIQ